MKKKIRFVTLITLAMVFSMTGTILAAPTDHWDEPTALRNRDNRPDPLSTNQAKLKEKALIAKVHGQTRGLTHEVAHGQYVELEREGEDPIWTVLGEFSDFSHNSMEEPDRTFNNTTIWDPDFSREYYLDLLFAEGNRVNSMREYYISQSSNRYAVYGDATDWISLPGVACDYDDGSPGPGDAISVWQFIIDAVDGWYDAQIDAGKTPQEIDDYLSQFDVWDRYDWDGDGNFNEPDGYIDHMQFVHAGEGNEAGGGAVGDCAIWSHSWFAHYELIGLEGPSPDFLIGGVQIGESSYWVNKYTIQPENGGVGVFAHEYAHDLGLPDLYDYTGENSTGFWTLMSSGSWLSQSDEDIGSAPGHMGVWEKFQLGWLNYEVAYAGAKSSHKLGPAEFNTKAAQGLFVVLPDKVITTVIAEPYSGSQFYYSGSDNDLDNSMIKAVNLPAASSLSAWVNYVIEEGWDYAYLIISTDGGSSWTNVETNLSAPIDPNGQNFGFGITGSSEGEWVALTADLSPFEGDVLIGFRYWTDSYVPEIGLMIDDIVIDGYPLDDAESDAAWTFTGFGLTTGTETEEYANFYVAEFRQYRDYDRGLANAYNFGWTYESGYGDFVEHFPYQDGLLISYWDMSFDSNDVTANCAAGRCGGVLLPIDAHPESLYRPDGGLWRNRIQTYDSTFSLERTNAITLHWQNESSYHPSLRGVRVFDDKKSYYDPQNPTASVITPVTGTQIRIKSVSRRSGFMQVEVRPSR